jgi:thiamine-phosphate pyrophosphorylase
MKAIGALHVITDTVLQSRFSHVELAEMAIAGGADAVQFRQKQGTTRQMVETALRMQEVCARAGVALMVNDRVDIALAAESRGVHLGQDDLPVAMGRKLLGEEVIIGASARTEEKILEAIAEGADYIGFGPVFKTTSKVDAEKPKGLEGLRCMCGLARVPVIAIGGITAETAYQVIRAGAHGIAVISAVCCQEDPEAATRRLVQEIQRAKEKRG